MRSSLCTHFSGGVSYWFQLGSHSDDFGFRKGVKNVFQNQWWISGLRETWIKWNELNGLIYFSYLGECCSAVLLWSSRNVLSNTKLHATFPQHEGEKFVTELSLLVDLSFKPMHKVATFRLSQCIKCKLVKYWIAGEAKEGKYRNLNPGREPIYHPHVAIKSLFLGSLRTGRLPFLAFHWAFKECSYVLVRDH